MNLPLDGARVNGEFVPRRVFPLPAAPDQITPFLCCAGIVSLRRHRSFRAHRPFGQGRRHSRRSSCQMATLKAAIHSLSNHRYWQRQDGHIIIKNSLVNRRRSILSFHFDFALDQRAAAVPIAKNLLGLMLCRRPLHRCSTGGSQPRR